MTWMQAILIFAQITIGGGVGISSQPQICGVSGGGDLGSKINACDAQLAANPGEIWVTGGGGMSTQVTISSTHVLRIFPGTYTSTVGSNFNSQAWAPTFIMQDHAALFCSSWQTIIQETTATHVLPSIVLPYANLVGQTPGQKDPKPISNDIHVENCHFQGMGLTPNTFDGTIGFDNCHKCSATNNWCDAVQSICINVGGSSATNGNSADEVLIDKNLITNSIEVEVAVVNGRNVRIVNNDFRSPATTAAGMIDLEPNLSTDYIQDIDIVDNGCDFTDASMSGSFYCVTMQVGTPVNPTQQRVRIHHNRCIGNNPGGTFPTPAINCFAAQGRYIEITDNLAVGTVQGGIAVSHFDLGKISGNTVICSASIGASAHDIWLSGSVTSSTIFDNRVVNDPTCPGIDLSVQSSIAETGTGNDFNLFYGNRSKVLTLNGANSKAFDNFQFDAAGNISLVASGGY